MKKILIITSDEKYYNKIENDVIKGNHQFFWVANIKEANKKIKAIAFDIMVLDQEDLTQKVCFSFIMKIANNTSFEKNPTIDFVIFYNRKNLKEIRGYASFVTRAFIKGTEKKIILSLLKDNDKALAIEKNVYKYGPIVFNTRTKVIEYGKQKDMSITRTQYCVLKEFLKHQGELIALNKLREYCALKYFYPSASITKYAISILRIKMPILAKKLIYVRRKGYILKNQGDIRE